MTTREVGVLERLSNLEDADRRRQEAVANLQERAAKLAKAMNAVANVIADVDDTAARAIRSLMSTAPEAEIRVVRKPDGKWDVERSGMWYSAILDDWLDTGHNTGAFPCEDIALAIADALRKREGGR